jgi:hypothetical protein
VPFLWEATVNIASFIRRIFGRRERKPVTPPLGWEKALQDGYSDAYRHWTRKHGRNHTLTMPKIVWMEKTAWTTDDAGKPLEMGGWNLSKVAFAMWVHQFPLKGSIQHECEHCFDLQVFGKTSEESVR